MAPLQVYSPSFTKSEGLRDLENRVMVVKSMWI